MRTTGRRLFEETVEGIRHISDSESGLVSRGDMP